MNLLIISISSIFILGNAANTIVKGGKLIMSQIIFRHGNRTPLDIYKASPCPANVYLDGLGAITNDGIENAYLFGRLLNERYFYNPATQLFTNDIAYKDIHSQSSDVERCSQTCLSLLAALIPVFGTRHEWKLNFEWVPFPIHSLPPQQDPVLRSENSNCLKLNELLHQKIKSPQVKKLMEDNKVFMSYLTQASGSQFDEKSLWDFYQTLVIESEDAVSKFQICGKTSSWADDNILRALKNVTIDFLNMYYDGNDREYALLLGGPLMAKLVESMKNTAEEKYPKIKLYSGHDSTIYHLMAALKISKNEYVNFLSSYVFELYQAPTGEKYIELYFHDVPSHQKGLQREPIPLCPEPCLLEKFQDVYRDVLSKDRELECKL